MLTLRGAPALSEFRLTKLLALCREHVPEAAAVYAEFVHFVDASAALSEDEQAVLDRLLEYGPRIAAGRAARAASCSWCRARAPSRPGPPRPRTSRATAAWRACAASSAAPPSASPARAAGAAREQLARARAGAARPDDADGARAAGGRRRPLRRAHAAAAHHGGRAGRRPRPRWSPPTGELGLALAEDEIDYLVDALRRAGARPHRRRADDVRAGQQRALPAQDLQRRAGSIDGKPQAQLAVPDHQEHATRRTARAACCRRTRTTPRSSRADGGALLPGPGDRRVGARARAHAHPDEGGDAQPPDGHLAVPGRGHGLGRRDPRRGRDRPRRQAQGGAHRLLVSNLRIPGYEQPVGAGPTASPRASSRALDIMLEGPLGGAAFNNEFGRPNLCGYFRTFELQVRHARAASRCAAITSRS